MTTIAYDGTWLCVDSQSSMGDLLSSRTRQKMWFDVGNFLCVAVAGETATYRPIIEWLRGGADPDGWKDWGAVAWAVRHDGVVERYASGYPEEVNGIDSDGSGAELALGAMAAGATAIKAVSVAIDYDLHSGGEVKSFNIRDAVASNAA